MNRALWPPVLGIILVLTTWSLPSGAGYAFIVFWALTCGAAYGATAVLLTRATLLFVISVALIATAALPVAALAFFASASETSWRTAIGGLLAASNDLLPLQGFEFLLPSTSALVAAWTTQRLLPNRDWSQGAEHEV